MPELQNRKQADAYRFLMAAVIDRAIDDLRGNGPKCHRAEIDRAMAFVLSDTCEAWCLELGIDYERIREKAAGLYRRIIAETGQEAVRKKRAGKPAKPLECVQIRKVADKRVIATDR